MNILDGKVHGTLIKNKDGKEIPADEFIVFRPQDNAFRNILPAYRAELVRLNAGTRQIEAVDHLIEKILMWRLENPGRCKVPDCASGETPTGW